MVIAFATRSKGTPLMKCPEPIFLPVTAIATRPPTEPPIAQRSSNGTISIPSAPSANVNKLQKYTFSEREGHSFLMDAVSLQDAQSSAARTFLLAVIIRQYL